MAKHTFRVVEAAHGWTVCIGAGMTSPFRTRARAIQEARRICDQLRLHGETAELIIEEAGEAPSHVHAHSAARLGEALRRASSHETNQP